MQQLAGIHNVNIQICIEISTFRHYNEFRTRWKTKFALIQSSILLFVEVMPNPGQITKEAARKWICSRVNCKHNCPTDKSVLLQFCSSDSILLLQTFAHFNSPLYPQSRNVWNSANVVPVPTKSPKLVVSEIPNALNNINVCFDVLLPSTATKTFVFYVASYSTVSSFFQTRQIVQTISNYCISMTPSTSTTEAHSGSSFRVYHEKFI